MKNNLIKVSKKIINQINRGKLSVFEFSDNIQIKRIFNIYGYKNEIRGNHAHKKTIQIFICMKGEIEIYLESINLKKKVLLNEKSKPLIVYPYTWVIIYFKKDGILSVLANMKYLKSDYINNKDQLKNIK